MQLEFNCEFEARVEKRFTKLVISKSLEGLRNIYSTRLEGFCIYYVLQLFTLVNHFLP